MRKFLSMLFAVLLSLFLPQLSFASGVDLSSLTAAVDFSTVSTAILAIGALLAAVYVGIKGVKIVIQMLRGG